MSITLACIAFSYGTNFEKLEAFAFVIPFKTLALDVIPIRGFWVLGLLSRGDGKGLDTKAL